MKYSLLLCLAIPAALFAEDGEKQKVKSLRDVSIGAKAITLGCTLAEVESAVGKAYWIDEPLTLDMLQKKGPGIHVWQMEPDEATKKAAEKAGSSPMVFLIVRIKNDKVTLVETTGFAANIGSK